MQAWLKTGKPFDAVFAATDLIAISALRVLAASGLRVPDAVAVVGFDGLEMGAHVHPTLTTVQQDLAQGAELLVDLLLKRIAGIEVNSVTMPGTLIVRESCGA
jgi:DNA-binding LacI/PurR family transcriptional regulator